MRKMRSQEKQQMYVITPKTRKRKSCLFLLKAFFLRKHGVLTIYLITFFLILALFIAVSLYYTDKIMKIYYDLETEHIKCLENLKGIENGRPIALPAPHSTINTVTKHNNNIHFKPYNHKCPRQNDLLLKISLVYNSTILEDVDREGSGEGGSGDSEETPIKHPKLSLLYSKLTNLLQLIRRINIPHTVRFNPFYTELNITIFPHAYIP